MDDPELCNPEIALKSGETQPIDEETRNSNNGNDNTAVHTEQAAKRWARPR